MSTLLAELTKFSREHQVDKIKFRSYDAEFRLASNASNSLTSPTKNSSLFGSRGAAMTMITSEISLRSWQYCVGARLKFWWRSRAPKKGSRVEADQR